MKAKLRNLISGDVIEVTSTTIHPQCSHGCPIWVDKDNQAITQVGLEKLALYEVFELEKEDE